LLGIAALLSACYTLTPGRGEPQVGTKVGFDVNDAGRVGLGGALGPEVVHIQGQLLAKDSAGYLLAVSGIRLIGGGEQVWSGEQVRVSPGFVGNTYERRFSLGRSIGFGALGIGGFAAFLAGRSLLGAGQNDPEPPDSGGEVRLGRP
jgi:hypothetical protein